MLGLHLWLREAVGTNCSCAVGALKPKDDVGATVLFTVIVVLLVLIAGLMSGTQLPNCAR